jgi:hypothetical protein
MSGAVTEMHASSSREVGHVRRTVGASEKSRNLGLARRSKQERAVEVSLMSGRVERGSIWEEENVNVGDEDPHIYITGWRRNIITLSSVTTPTAP